MMSDFINKIKKYFDLKIEFYRLGVVEKTALLLGSIILFFFISILVVVLLILVVILLNQVLLVWIDIAWLVTLIEILFVTLSLIVLLCFKEKLIIRPVANIFIRILLKEREKKNHIEETDK